MPVALPVSAVIAHCNPYGSSAPWGVPVDMADVKLALSQRRLAAEPGSDDHAARIAYLVENPATDPIAIDVGVPALGYWGPSWMITDGNHRLAAAIYRGDATILALVDGQMDHAFELFGVDCDENLDAEGSSPPACEGVAHD